MNLLTLVQVKINTQQPAGYNYTNAWLTSYIANNAAARAAILNATPPLENVAALELPLLNRHLRHVIGMSKGNTLKIRECLTDNTTVEAWLVDFERTVLPYLTTNHL